MELISLVSYGTVVSLSGALALLVYQLIRQRMSPARTIGTFSFLILFLVMGWLIVELIETTTGGYLSSLVHFLMMVAFAIGFTLNWYRSSHSHREKRGPALALSWKFTDPEQGVKAQK